MGGRVIIRMTGPGGDTWRWETGGGTLKAASVSLKAGDQASSAQATLVDTRLELANTLPQPAEDAAVRFEAWLGEQDAETPPKVFGGFASQYTPQGGELEIMAVDESRDLRREQKSRNVAASTPLELARFVAGPRGLSVDASEADLSDIQYSQIVQHGESDWSMLNRLLGQVGHRAFVRGSELIIQKVGQTRADGVTPRLRYGDNVREYSFQLDEATSSDTPSMYDREGAQAGSGGGGPATERPVHLQRTGLRVDAKATPSFTDQQLERQLEAQARGEKILTGSITATEPYPNVDVDDGVELVGFGDRFSGIWLIESLSHTHTGYTTFEIHRGSDD